MSEYLDHLDNKLFRWALEGNSLTPLGAPGLKDRPPSPTLEAKESVMAGSLWQQKKPRLQMNGPKISQRCHTNVRREGWGLWTVTVTQSYERHMES